MCNTATSPLDLSFFDVSSNTKMSVLAQTKGKAPFHLWQPPRACYGNLKASGGI